MSHKMDERVEKAVHDLWIDQWNNDGTEARRLLEEAASEGDGDAYFFLARTCLDKSFINPRFGFKENEKLGKEYLDKSIELGSAIGMLGAIRLADYKPRSGSYVHAPYHSLREIWDEVNQMAEDGQVFCQYMIANAYYYGDCLPMLGYTKSQVNTHLLKSFAKRASVLYEKVLEKGLVLGIGNLIDIHMSGDYGIPVDEEKFMQIVRIGATKQSGQCENMVGELIEEETPKEAFELYNRAYQHGEYSACLNLGRMYSFDGKMPMDLHRAINYFEEGIRAGSEVAECQSRLGQIYFHGGDGVSQDCEKAFQLFKQAEKECDWASDMLGTCYLKGLGTEVNYRAARKQFLKDPTKKLAALGLGEIYSYGLGVKRNVGRGIMYLNLFPRDPRSMEVKTTFRKTIFGWRKIKKRV